MGSDPGVPFWGFRFVGFGPGVGARDEIDQHKRIEVERIEALHPDPAKAGVRILRWKYEVVRAAILDVLPLQEPGLHFKELAPRVRACVSEEVLENLGSVSWYTTTVKLDLEARGEVARVEGAGPQRLVRVI